MVCPDLPEEIAALAMAARVVRQSQALTGMVAAIKVRVRALCEHTGVRWHQPGDVAKVTIRAHPRQIGASVDVPLGESLSPDQARELAAALMEAAAKMEARIPDALEGRECG
jgi:hypothetical protein